MDDINLEDAYNKTRNWIVIRLAQIIREEKNSFIEIKTGSAGKIYYDYVAIIFNLKQESKVIIYVTIEEKYISDTEYKDLWGHKYYLEQYCTYMGIELSDDLIKRIYSKSYVEMNFKSCIINAILAYVVFTALVYGSFSFVGMPHNIILNFIPVVFIFFIILFESNMGLIRRVLISYKRKSIYK